MCKMCLDNKNEWVSLKFEYHPDFAQLVKRLNETELRGGRNALYDKEWVHWVETQKRTGSLDKQNAVKIIKLFLDAIGPVCKPTVVRVYRITTMMKMMPILWRALRTDGPHRKFTVTFLEKCVELQCQIEEMAAECKASKPIISNTFRLIVQDLSADGQRQTALKGRDLSADGQRQTALEGRDLSTDHQRQTALEGRDLSILEGQDLSADGQRQTALKDKETLKILEKKIAGKIGKMNLVSLSKRSEIYEHDLSLVREALSALAREDTV